MVVVAAPLDMGGEVSLDSFLVAEPMESAEDISVTGTIADVISACPDRVEDANQGGDMFDDAVLDEGIVDEIIDDGGLLSLPPHLDPLVPEPGGHPSELKAAEAAAPAAHKKKNISSKLPRTFFRVLQALVCGSGIKTSLVYSCRANDRYTLRLDGPWQGIVRRCASEGWTVRECEMYPRAPCFDEIDTWGSVLLKMQTVSGMDPDEEPCHHLVTERVPDISPRFILGMTVGTLRVSFMEWLDDCVSVYQLHKTQSPLLDRCMYQKALSAVRRMWLDAGVLHCDLHANNVLVSRADGRVYVIDYGMAVRMPHSLRDRLAHCIEQESMRPAEAYDQTCKDMAYKVILRRGYEVENDDWNDDASFLISMKSFCCKRKKHA